MIEQFFKTVTPENIEATHQRLDAQRANVADAETKLERAEGDERNALSILDRAKDRCSALAARRAGLQERAFAELMSDSDLSDETLAEHEKLRSKVKLLSRAISAYESFERRNVGRAALVAKIDLTKARERLASLEHDAEVLALGAALLSVVEQTGALSVTPPKFKLTAYG